MMTEKSEAATGAPRPAKNRSHRRLFRYVRRILAGLFVLGAVALIVVAWMPKPVPVETAETSRGDLVVSVSEDGRARVKDRYTVSAPLSGNVARIVLRPGDAIEQGAPLAHIVPLAAPLLDSRSRKTAEAQVAAAAAARRRARAEIQRAKMALDFAKKQRARERALVKSGSTPQAAVERAELEEQSRAADVTSAEFAAKVAEYEYRMAQAALGRHESKDSESREEQMTIPSPVSGRVLKVIQQSEGVVQAGAPLIEVGDPAALEIVVDVLTSDAVKIDPGAETHLERWGGPELLGRVRVIEPSAFTKLSSLGVEEQRVNVIIDLTAPYETWKQLGDGYRVEARIVADRAKDAVKAPASAVFRHGEGWAVYVVEEETAQLVPVSIGLDNPLEVEIRDGLTEGRRVVLHPGDRVADGVSVRPR